jgi:hypothetical protein
MNIPMEDQLKDRFEEACRLLGLLPSHVVQGLVTDWLDSQAPRGEEGQKKAVYEKLLSEQNKIADELGKLEGDDGKILRSRYIASSLLEAYPFENDGRHDWLRIRNKALTDFRAAKKPEWAQHWSIRREFDIRESCRIAERLDELKARDSEITHQLTVLDQELTVLKEKQPSTVDKQPHPVKEAQPNQQPLIQQKAS